MQKTVERVVDVGAIDRIYSVLYQFQNILKITFNLCITKNKQFLQRHICIKKISSIHNLFGILASFSSVKVIFLQSVCKLLYKNSHLLLKLLLDLPNI